MKINEIQQQGCKNGKTSIRAGRRPRNDKRHSFISFMETTIDRLLVDSVLKSHILQDKDDEMTGNEALKL